MKHFVLLSIKCASEIW